MRDALGLEPGRLAVEAERVAREMIDVGVLARLGLDLVTALAGVVLILITALFIAVNPAPLTRGILRLFPPARRESEEVRGRIRETWMGWLKGTAIDMVAIGVLLYLGLTLIGLELAIFFAVLGALFEFAPYIGPTVAAIPAIAFALVDSLEPALLTLVVFLVVNQVEGNVLIPMIMSQAVKLHPAVIAVGVVVVGLLFGLIGLLVAVPIVAAVLIVVEEAWIKPREVGRGPPAGQTKPAREERPAEAEGESADRV